MWYFINTDIPEVPLKLFKLTTQFTVIINILYNSMQPGIIKKIEDKLEKVGDVIQEKIEAAGNFPRVNGTNTTLVQPW